MVRIANIFRRAKKAGYIPYPPFDRATRDNLHRRYEMVLPSDARCMLIGDSRGVHMIVEPSTMRLARRSKYGRWLVTKQRIFKRV